MAQPLYMVIEPKRRRLSDPSPIAFENTRRLFATDSTLLAAERDHRVDFRRAVRR